MTATPEDVIRDAVDAAGVRAAVANVRGLLAMDATPAEIDEHLTILLAETDLKENP